MPITTSWWSPTARMSGQSPNIEWWLGEAPARTNELSLEVSHIREAIHERLGDPAACERWLVNEAGLGTPAAAQLPAYVDEGHRVLRTVPTARCIVAER